MSFCQPPFHKLKVPTSVLYSVPVGRTRRSLETKLNACAPESHSWLLQYNKFQSRKKDDGWKLSRYDDSVLRFARKGYSKDA